MAETIGVVSGLAGLGAVTFQSSVALYQTITSYQSHQQRVCDLADETSALSGVLRSLNETVRATSDLDFSALEIPLRRCGKACNEFEQEIKKCSLRSGDSRASFRDWARLRYMGDDIDGFRRLLASYKMTITIALTDASLRQSTTTAESIEGYTALLDTARADLEDRLERIVEKLDGIEEKVAGSASPSDASEVRQIKEEKLSTEKSLEICAQLSEHIDQIQLAARYKASSNDGSDASSIPERITREGLDECKDSLSRMANRLKAHEKTLFDRLTNSIRASIKAPDEMENLARLTEELESTREQMDILSTAGSYLGKTTSVIENRATGDAFQVMVSTNGKVLHGTNQGEGWRTRQFGGYMDNETVRQLSRDMVHSYDHIADNEGQAPASNPPCQPLQVPDTEAADLQQTKFAERYGKGSKLTAKRAENEPVPSTLEAADGTQMRRPPSGQR